MKSWATILIFLSVFKMISKSILPKGEKSPLYAPFRFLFSMILILALLSPFLPLMKGEGTFRFATENLSTSTTSEDVNVLLLKRFAKKLDEQIRAAFPNTEFSFEVHTDENKTPILIKVVSDHKDVAQKISNWIRENYNIEAKAK